MKLSIYQIDAFAEDVFEGNPAAVVPLEEWLPDATMQKIAEENNLAETAFFVRSQNGFSIRWFTPKKEVKLCGHATLASAFVLFKCLGFESDVVHFDSLSGRLSVSNGNDVLTMDFPSQVPVACETPEALVKGLGAKPQQCLRNEDFLAVFRSEEEISSIIPNHHHLARLDLRGVIITAPSSDYDFVCRFFAPKYGIPEDPVTGSAYTQLVPYWAAEKGKTAFRAKQVSARGGKVFCELKGDRVLISGTAVQYSEGTIKIKT